MNGFLVLLLVLVGHSWSMPVDMDKALKDLGQADMDLTNFFKSLEKKDFDHLPELYNRLMAAFPKLKNDLERMHKLDTGKGLRSLKRLLNIQLDTDIFRINGLMAHDEDEGGKVLTDDMEPRENNNFHVKLSTTTPKTRPKSKSPLPQSNVSLPESYEYQPDDFQLDDFPPKSDHSPEKSDYSPKTKYEKKPEPIEKNDRPNKAGKDTHTFKEVRRALFFNDE